MKFDTSILFPQLDTIVDLTRAAEEIGFDGVWLAETRSDPFLSLALAAEHSQRIELGTAIAVAFPRSPTTLAHIAWDLSRYSDGRFVLGLGPQVRAHNERRFGVKWEKPVRKLRETIEAIHAVWDCWQNETPLKYEGEFFKLDLMTPFFSPPPLNHPRPPIYISAVNPLMLKLAGKLCDGIHLHSFHTTQYLDELAIPTMMEGLAQTGRNRTDLTISTSTFVIPTDDAKPAAHFEAFARQQLAFYLSTPAYRLVPEMHGWTEIVWKLSKMARRGEWDEMPNLLSDEMMEMCVLTGKWSELPRLAHQRYGDRIDRLSFYLPFEPGESDEGWKAAIEGFRRVG